MKSSPYIAVSAFETEDQVRTVGAGLGDLQWPHPQGHIPLIGFAVDRGTLEGRVPPSPRKVTDLGTLNRLIAAVPSSAMASLHFDMTTSGTDPRGALYDLMERIEKPDRIHSVQLNGVRAEDLEPVRDQLWNPSYGLIAPLHLGLVEAGRVDEFLSACRGLVAHVLVDLSGGRGEVLDKSTLQDLLPRLAALEPEVGLALAGGLSEANVASIFATASSIVPGRPISVDTESAVRIRDSLDPQAALRFYGAAYQALNLSKTQ